MPELPEVETVARTLAPHVVGRAITDVTLCHVKAWQGSVKKEDFARLGFTIKKVSRRGKLLLLLCSQETTETFYKEIGEHVFALAFHLKMTGKVFVHPRGTPPFKHSSAVFTLDNEELLFFDDVRKFGYIRVLSQENIQDWAFWQKLGAEPFLLKAEEFASLLYGRKSNIKSLLLNQEIIAGIGNIYADESLFRAKLNPKLAAQEFSFEQLKHLHTVLLEVLQESIDACGSSIRDYRTANGDVGQFQNSFYVYGRGGEKCRLCATPLEKEQIAGRTTVFCKNCQK